MHLKDHNFLIFDKAMPIHAWYQPVDGEEVTDKYNGDTIAPFSELTISDIENRAIYLHIPFCTDNICAFCTINRKINCSSSTIDKYVSAIIKEIEIKSKIDSIRNVPVESIWIGGGTPSVLSPDQIRRIGHALRTNLDLSELKEWSFENNAKSVTEEKLIALKEIGVTHIHIGGQTLSPKYRKLFDLTATKQQLLDAISLMNRHFDNVSVDMIFGMNGQSLEELAKDVLEVTSLGVRLIDFYPLTSVTSNRKLLDNYAKEKLEAKSEQELTLFGVYVRQLMELQGYVPCTGHGYVRCDDTITVDSENGMTRDYLCYYHKAGLGTHKGDIIGFGAGAFSLTTNFLVQNAVSINEYINNLEKDCVNGEVCLVDDKVMQSKPISAQLPYFGYVSKSDINLKLVAPEVLESLARCVEKGVLLEDEYEYKLARKSWYWNSHLMFFLSPTSSQKSLLDFVESKTVKNSMKKQLGDVLITPEFS
ncbi:radical SAM protein [Vibrio bivalvicida]|uniref:Radical SAM core domain-containing protein n=1 Tax=Vibrio bivalvicida TaxID=1276888 RepID=A0A177Y5R9_9VIBR|nr:radical SAM protein [Vibrio bivalvicida]OAJ96199.1 hypothetical protein APB76_00075 [Vibrio bivalvicida]